MDSHVASDDSGQYWLSFRNPFGCYKSLVPCQVLARLSGSLNKLKYKTVFDFCELMSRPLAQHLVNML